MIENIRLQNFRSYKDESFEFEDAVNIVVGPNASGKTNLLEGVLMLARGSSYKARDFDLLQHNKPWARLDGFFSNESRSVKIETKDERIEKTFDFNNKIYRRLRLELTIPTVFFEPNHLQQITRGPDQRREYLDDLLERSDPEFKSLSASYRRALAQRNHLLKQDPAHATQQLFAWNVRLSELGAKIASARHQLIEQINKDISKTYSKIAGKRSRLQLEYACHFPAELYASKLLTKLESTTDLDFKRGFTAYGPHREDIIFYLNQKPVGSTASRGETRSLMLALKIFELELLEKVRGQKPILLLDDVFSELDGARRRALVDYLHNQQTIITTTDADAVVEYFAGKQSLIALTSKK